MQAQLVQLVGRYVVVSKIRKTAELVNTRENTTYGATVVLSKMFRSFKSFRSGRVWRCFSKESRRCWFPVGLRVGEIGESSIAEEDMFGSLAVLSCKMLIIKFLLLDFAHLDDEYIEGYC